MSEWLIIRDLDNELELVHVHANNVASSSFKNKECALCGVSVPKDLYTQIKLANFDIISHEGYLYLIDIIRFKEIYNPTIVYTPKVVILANHKNLLKNADSIEFILIETYKHRFQEINNLLQYYLPGVKLQNEDV